MKRYFLPITMLMGKLRYPQKFALVLFLSLMSLGSIGGVLLLSNAKDIQILKQARAELNYVTEMRQLLESVSRHRGIVYEISKGDPSLTKEMLGLRSRIDNEFLSLNSSNNKVYQDSTMTNEFTLIYAQWKKIKKSIDQADAWNIFVAHNQLISDISASLEYVTNVSADDSDKKYINEMIVNQIPDLISNIGQVLGIASDVYGKGFLSEEQRKNLTLLMGRILFAYESLSQIMELKNSDYNNTAVKLPRLDSNMASVLDKFSNYLLYNLTQQNNRPVNVANFYEFGTDAIDVSFRLYDEWLSTSDGILASRIERARVVVYSTILTTVLLLLMVIYVHVGIYYSVADGITEIDTVTRRLAMGDLTVRAKLIGCDETKQIGNSLNKLADQYSESVALIGACSRKLAASAEELSALTSHSHTNTHHQQTQTELVSASMDQLSMSVAEVTKNIKNAAMAAEEAQRESLYGLEVVEETIKSIQRLSIRIDGASDVVHKLEADSQEITTVLEVIKDVAAQTSLLALNAAIEAASVGEHGKGFAVVADEVRALAGSTRESADLIHSNIDSVLYGSKKAVEVMMENRKSARRVIDNATETSRSLSDISRAIEKISELSRRIANVSEKQNTVTKETSKNVEVITGMSNHATYSTFQTASASEDLAQQAAVMQDLVERFTI